MFHVQIFMAAPFFQKRIASGAAMGQIRSKIKAPAGKCRGEKQGVAAQFVATPSV